MTALQPINVANTHPLAPPSQTLWQGRLQRFKAHRLGWVSFWCILVISVLCMGANMVANDKPLVVKYAGSLYFPAFKAYSENTFGGEFNSEAEYKDPAVATLITRDGGWLLWPPVRFADQSVNYGLDTPVPSPPSASNWLGTDDNGRDVVARILYGLRLSLMFGVVLTLLGSIIGITIGAIQGYFGGLADLLGQRVLDVWGSMPQLFMIIILVSFFAPSVWVLLAIMLLFGWMDLIGLVRAEFLRARNFDYIKAARAMGFGNARIIFKHILPNALSSSLSRIPFILVANMTALTTLDYLGYGLPPGSPSLGELIRQGKDNLDAPWIGLAAFFTLAIVLSMLIFIGEAARDAFDPRTQHQRP